MAFGIPVVPKFTTVWKFGFSTFLQVVYLLPDIDKVQGMEIYITKRSYNLQREYRNYVWAKDKDGNYINEPEDHDNHGIDAARYYVLGELLGKIQKPKDLTGIFTH